ncbi:hypothetical protein [Humibacillus xanthopallidus]|nr:hypothetical protein [Humibacillus xanthopallidus]
MLIFAVATCFIAAPVSGLSFMVAKGLEADWGTFPSWLGSWHSNVEDDVMGMALGVAGVALSLWIAVALTGANDVQTAVRARAQAVALDAIVLYSTATAAVLEVLFIPVALGKNGPMGAAVPFTLAALLCGLAPIAEVRADSRWLEARRLGERLESVAEDFASGPPPLPFRTMHFRNVLLFRVANPKRIMIILGCAASLIILWAILHDGTKLSWWKIALFMALGGGATFLWSACALDLAAAVRARWVARGAGGSAELLIWPLGVAMWAVMLGASIQEVGGRSAVVILTPLICASLPIVYATLGARSRVQRRARAAWLKLEAERLEEGLTYQEERLVRDRLLTAPTSAHT